MLAQILHRLVRVQQMQSHQITVQREIVEILAAEGDPEKVKSLAERVKASEEQLSLALITTTEAMTTASSQICEIADELVDSQGEPEVVHALAGKLRELAAAMGAK